MKRIRDFAGGALAICAMCLVSARVGAGAGDAPYVSATPMTTPRLFGENVISTPDDEFGGQFSPDGRTLWFSRSVPRFHLEAIVSNRRDGRWSEPTIAPFSGIWHEYDVTLSATTTASATAISMSATGATASGSRFRISGPA